MSTVITADDVVEQSIESKIIALSRKAVSLAFWRKEVEKELKEMGWNDLTFNTSSPSWEKALEKIEDYRINHPYQHRHCSQECKARG